MRYDGTGSAGAGGTRPMVQPVTTGRWEVRWRAGAGSGALGVFVLGTDADGSPHGAVLDPGAGTLTVSDDLTGGQRTVLVDAHAFHRVAVTVTSAAVTWQLDGTEIATWAATAARPPLWPALQVDSPPRCRGAGAASCGGPAEPSVVDVDWMAYSPV